MQEREVGRVRVRASRLVETRISSNMLGRWADAWGKWVRWRDSDALTAHMRVRAQKEVKAASAVGVLKSAATIWW